MIEILNTNQDAWDRNNNSLVLKVTYGEIDFLMTGDIERRKGRQLYLKYGNELASEVVKVPHHGSSNFNTDFVRATIPDYAVICAGAGNDYDHPRDTTISIYNEIGAEIFRTDISGNIEFRTNGTTVSVNAVPYTVPASPPTTEYVASKRSKVFHLSSCTSAEKIKSENLVEFSSRDEAVASGRRPCKRCKP